MWQCPFRCRRQSCRLRLCLQWCRCLPIRKLCRRHRSRSMCPPRRCLRFPIRVLFPLQRRRYQWPPERARRRDRKPRIPFRQWCGWSPTASNRHPGNSPGRRRPRRFEESPFRPPVRRTLAAHPPPSGRDCWPPVPVRSTISIPLIE